MSVSVAKIKISNEVDIVLAHKRAKQLAEMTGLNFSEQARFAAAISEISRNAIEHAEGGEVQFYVRDMAGSLCLSACVEDKGKGIGDLNEILRTSYSRGKGLGIKSSKKLVDFFDIESFDGQGTKVKMSMKLPMNHPPINNQILKGWKEFFDNQLPISPYEELKKQNDELIETLEQLKYKNLLVENQLEEIKKLNMQLQLQNQEIQKMNKEREERNSMLEEKNMQLDEFSYIVSHDLKAPLNNMLGLLDILTDEAKDESKASEVEMFKGQVLKMHRMIESILSYARAGKGSVEKSTVDLSRLFSEILPTIHRRSGIKMVVPKDLPVLYTEEIYLEQVLCNLINNAAKHHDSEEGCVQVEVSKIGNDMWEFTVSDDGPGINPAKKERIFDLFHTIKTNKSMHSTGIGLSIVKKLVEMKGGKIRVEDNQPRGTKFIFTWSA